MHAKCVHLCLLGLALVSSSCVSSTYFPLGERAFPARPADHPVILFDHLDDVRRPYVKVARVLGEGDSERSWADVLAAMRKSAREAGADAMVLRTTGVAEWCDEEGAVSRNRILRALGIRFVEDR